MTSVGAAETTKAIEQFRLQLVEGDQDGGAMRAKATMMHAKAKAALAKEGATVLGSTDGKDWPIVDAAVLWPQFGHSSDCDPGTTACAFPHQAFVFAWDVKNVTLTGKGTIDANSKFDTWWGCAKDLSKAPCSGHGRPHLLDIYNGVDVEMRRAEEGDDAMDTT